MSIFYDEGLIYEFIGTYFRDDKSGRDELKKAHDIFQKLVVTWKRDQVSKKFV